MKHKHILWFVGILLTLTLLVTACSSETQENAPTEEYQVNLPAVNTSQEDEQAYPASESQSEVADQAYPEPQAQSEAASAAEEAYPVPEEAPEKPAPRTALQATDPNTVSLASGKLQLVEFFAFW